jgi:Bifunctional DNA primase/polymerase, N-terminal
VSLPAGHYWATRPGAIVGLPLGKAGLVVIDLDVGHADGQDGTAEFGKILDHYSGSVDGVPIVRTWSGGYHLYYRQPIGRDPLGNREGALAGCGINVRGAGGYTIAPGSVMATGEFYECVAGWPDLCEAFVAGAIPEIPGWLVERIEWRDDSAPSSSAPVFTDVDADRLRKWALGALRNKASALAMVREGNRNNALNSAVFIRRWSGPAPSTS